MGKVDYFELPENISTIIFTLKEGQISEPIKSGKGYYLFQVIKKYYRPIKNVSYEKRKEELLLLKRNQIISSIIEEKINELKINDPHLKAIFARQEGDYQKAIYAYQELIGQDPQSPYPDYYIAKMKYQINPKDPTVKEEIEKALIKTELNPSLDFPELHRFQKIVARGG